jgi:hypothetical protein
LFKTDYEEGRLQPTPAGHPQLATPRANHFLLVLALSRSFQTFPDKNFESFLAQLFTLS